MHIHTLDQTLVQLATQRRAAADNPDEAGVYDAAWSLANQQRQEELARMTDKEVYEYELVRAQNRL